MKTKKTPQKKLDTMKGKEIKSKRHLRLAASLKSNLSKRKAQARNRINKP